MKICKKITIGIINGVRGGFKAMALFGLRPDPNNKDVVLGDRDRVTVMTIIGLAQSYTKKVDEKMGVSYGFTGEFQAINKDGEKCIGPVCYLPEPAQYMLRYHSFYAAHRHGAYRHLMNEQDERMFEWVRKFNPYDLYSNGSVKPNVPELQPYYEDLIAEFFPGEIAW